MRSRGSDASAFLLALCRTGHAPEEGFDAGIRFGERARRLHTESLLPRLAGFAEVDRRKNAHHDEAKASCDERGVSRGRNSMARKKKASNQKVRTTPEDINKW
jgi:hypothetical protein